MSRLTITLTEPRYRALKEAAVRRRKTIGQLIEESLEFYGIKSQADAHALLQRARKRAAMDDAAAQELANAETAAARKP